MTTTTKHDWRDVLLEAASIVEEGWSPRGSLHRNKEGEECCSKVAVRSCAEGAIIKAGGLPRRLLRAEGVGTVPGT